MKKVLLVLPVIALIGCSRPETPPPVTPAQPPTVESSPTSVPAPTVDSTAH